MAYECWNPACGRYAGDGTTLGAQDVYVDPGNYLRCRTCRQYVKTAGGRPDTEAAKPLAGAAGGALLGWAVGGPPGAFVGGLLGLFFGAVSVDPARRRR